MEKKRGAGVLLHISSLPGLQGCGTLGGEARSFARWLHSAGISWWQVLPLHPVCPHLGFSPYASTSTFAGNELLICLEELRKDGFLPSDYARQFSELSEDPDFVDWENLKRVKHPLLQQAADLFFARAEEHDQAEFTAFIAGEKAWLEDYTLFAALAGHFGSNDWTTWERSVSGRDQHNLQDWRRKLAAEIRFQEFTQFMFFRQWRRLKTHCRSLGIGLIGDLPFYVNLESADAWANPSVFQIDRDSCKPIAVSGVPPDYFSSNGQRWGNPLYRWFSTGKSLHEPTVSWWIRRLKHAISLTDLLRLDHFRAFSAYWSIPAAELTAIRGKWRPGPGRAFFSRLKNELNGLPFIAEDLGFITPDVEKLRCEFDLPGMKILQFAFSETSDHPYLPHNYGDPDWVVYTGTHDNDTSNGWFYGMNPEDPTRRFALDYCAAPDDHAFHRHFMRLALASTAWMAVLPMQDILGYGRELRMNIPGQSFGNWRWRLTPGTLSPDLAAFLYRQNELYGRLPK